MTKNILISLEVYDDTDVSEIDAINENRIDCSYEIEERKE